MSFTNPRTFGTEKCHDSRQLKQNLLAFAGRLCARPHDRLRVSVRGRSGAVGTSRYVSRSLQATLSLGRRLEPALSLSSGPCCIHLLAPPSLFESSMTFLLLLQQFLVSQYIFPASLFLIHCRFPPSLPSHSFVSVAVPSSRPRILAFFCFGLNCIVLPFLGRSVGTLQALALFILMYSRNSGSLVNAITAVENLPDRASASKSTVLAILDTTRSLRENVADVLARIVTPTELLKMCALLLVTRRPSPLVHAHVARHSHDSQVLPLVEVSPTGGFLWDPPLPLRPPEHAPLRRCDPGGCARSGGHHSALGRFVQRSAPAAPCNSADVVSSASSVLW